MISKEFTGTPWHTEQMHRAEGDERRHKSRCKNYKENGCCSLSGGHCPGSAHCRNYRALSEAAFKERQKIRQKAKQGSVQTEDQKEADKKYDETAWF